MQTQALWVIALLGALQGAACWWMLRTLRKGQQVEGRIGHLADALSLLTETTEAGFRATAAEIGRLAEVPRRQRARSGASANRRVAAARGRGRSVEQIAADEGISEGEVALRLGLQGPAGGEQRARTANRPKPRRRAAAAAARA